MGGEGNTVVLCFFIFISAIRVQYMLCSMGEVMWCEKIYRPAAEEKEAELFIDYFV